MDNNRHIVNLESIGELAFDLGLSLETTGLSEISGLINDGASDLGDITFDIDFSDRSSNESNIELPTIELVDDASGDAIVSVAIDFEDVALTNEVTLLVSADEDVSGLIEPLIGELDFKEIIDDLAIDDNLLFTVDSNNDIQTETIPTIAPVVETPDLDNDSDADDPAIYLNPNNPEQSLVITTFGEGGLRVYDLAGSEIQSITPEDVNYQNVDIVYGVEYQSQIPGETATVDLAIASDRANDTLAIFTINPDASDDNGLPGGRILTDAIPRYTPFPESIFGVDDGEATASGLATYTSPVDGKNYVFVSQADSNQIAQLELRAGIGPADGFEVNFEVVRTFEVPVPEGEDAIDYQVEGMVVDRETGILYAAQEDFGIWKFDIEADGNLEPELVDTVTENTDSTEVPYSNLVVFGDSLSDRGNVFNATEGLIPPSPPYSEGRFSNGDLIIDTVTDSLELPESESFLTGGSNYAFAGAQTGEGTSEFGLLGDLPETFDVPNLGQQVDLYLSTQTPTESDLFYIYGGANDFIDPLLRGEALPTSEEIVGNITNDITDLAAAGAQTFVVPNLPPLGEIPLFLEQPEATVILNDATDDFNQLLDTELDAIAAELDITIIEPDVNSTAIEIQANPTDFGLTNTTDAVLDLNNLSLTGNPEEFFYWDTFHPTAAATDFIAQEVIELLPSGVVSTGETPSLVGSVDGLTIYYGEDGNGYLLASSQGNDTFAIYDRAGSNSYLDSFAVENVEGSDGADVINVPLSEDYPAGLLVVQDDSNEPTVFLDDPETGEVQFNTNFKFVSLADFESTFANLPIYDPNAFDPRNPEPRTLIDGVAGGDDVLLSDTSNYVAGDEGAEQFSIADPESLDIANFELDSDFINFNSLGIGFEDLSFTQQGDNTAIALGDTDVAILSGVDANSLNADSFAFA